MDKSQEILVTKGMIYGYSKLENVLVNFYHVFDSRVGRVFFCHTKSFHELMFRLTIEWEDGIITTITMKNCKKYKVKYKNDFVSISYLKVGNKSRFGSSNLKGKIIKKEHVIAIPCYIFTTIDLVEVNRVLVKCKTPLLLRHIKQLSRLNRVFASPILHPGSTLLL